MSQHTSEAVHVLFNKFIAHISQRVIEEYGISYMTYDNTKNNWRYRLPYTAKTEAFLILESKVFLRMLDEDSGRTSNPGFLKPLVNQMADFLSAYTMRAGVEKRGIAIKQLKQKLWDEKLAVIAEAVTVAREAVWLYEKFGEGEYKDILGLCKLADRTEIAEKGYSLTPGAYVGVAPVEDDGVDFAARMAEIHSELLTLQAESNELMETISKNMKEMGL